MNKMLFEKLKSSLTGIADVTHLGFTNKIYITRPGINKIVIIMNDKARSWLEVDVRLDHLRKFDQISSIKVLQAVTDFLNGNVQAQARSSRYLLMYPEAQYRYVTDVKFVCAKVGYNDEEENIEFKYSDDPRYFSQGELDYIKQRVPIVAPLIDEWKVEA